MVNDQTRTHGQRSYRCPWCGTTSDGTQLTCPGCGVSIDVREHAFLVASHHINYSYVRIKGLRNILFGGQGMFMDRFVTTTAPGLLMLHGYGNVLERNLKAGESILVEPGAFLYKDSSVTMDVQPIQLTSGWFGGNSMNLAKMTGPGRIGIQSMYVHHTTE